eukprot:5739463-Amphidinium_carterae.1
MRCSSNRGLARKAILQVQRQRHRPVPHPHTQRQKLDRDRGVWCFPAPLQRYPNVRMLKEIREHGGRRWEVCSSGTVQSSHICPAISTSPSSGAEETHEHNNGLLV